HAPPRCAIFPYTTLFRSPALELLLLDGVVQPHDLLDGRTVGPRPVERDLAHAERLRVVARDGEQPEDGLLVLRLRERCDHPLLRSEEHTSELQSRENLVC